MDWLAHVPSVDSTLARQLARDLYDLDASAEPLPSERDRNFRLDTTDGRRFVLKIANGIDDRSLLEAQTQAMTIVAERASAAPRVHLTRDGSTIATCAVPPGGRHFVRLLSWLPGEPLARVPRPSSSLLHDLGRLVATVDRALESFDHPALHRPFYWDLASGLDTCRSRVGLVNDARLRSSIARILEDVERRVAPTLPRLRTGAIHNDANDHNVIVGPPTGAARTRAIAGLIDFGDMVHGATIGDLAVAAAYAALRADRPLAAISQVTAGYHADRPLDGDELAALFGLVRLRLAMSACVAAEQTAARPDDPYLSISQTSVTRVLPALGAISTRFAEYTLRAACGFDAVPRATIVADWLARQADEAAPVLGCDLRRTPTMVVDLGVSSPLVAGDPRDNTEPALTTRIRAAMAEHGATVGIGRYGEARLLYSTPLFAGGTDDDARQRTIHLGIDLFADAGTTVVAPLDGTVHAIARNPAPLDYGTVVILEHTATAPDDQRAAFYTIYGHLAPDALERLRVGDRIARGDRLGTLGTADVNGGWTPHLHLQLALDLVDRGTDLRGVAFADDRDVWTAISPDPSALCHVHGASALSERQTAQALLARRRAHVGRNVRTSYETPMAIARGWMQYLYDADGRRYLDAYNNVPHVGHAHPRIVCAAAEQLRVLNTNTRYLHESLAAFAERLTATLPPPLSVCYFVNSGSEANELALRLARAHTGVRDVIVLEAGYHGITTTLIEVSPYKYDGPGGSGRAPWVHAVPAPDTYRGPYRADDPEAGPKSAAFVSNICDSLARDGTGVAAFLAESCPSVGGQLLPPEGYLANAYRAVRAAGGVCIADEVQTGYGRLGTAFWGFELQHVVPDVVVLGKPIGNGYPIGAVVTTPEIAASFDNGMELFSTFGGSTVSCAVGLAVLEVVLSEGLQAHARTVGDDLVARLRGLAGRHRLIGDVRGSGLFLGVELVRDRETREPATDEAAFVVNRLREAGILTGTDGPFHNVIKIRPPMPFDRSNAETLAASLDRILDEEFRSSRGAIR